MLVEKRISTKKQNLLIFLLVILVLLTVFVISRSISLPKIPKHISKTLGPTKPSYLSKPVPSLKMIKHALENPKIEQIQYVKPSQPITSLPSEQKQGKTKIKLPPEIGPIGRPNPFIPF
ncbi:hypothetical protein J7K86_02040 [bacterium]|nr:hypothetical protein [bacterium]